jgi:hypothetical protein
MQASEQAFIEAPPLYGNHETIHSSNVVGNHDNTGYLILNAGAIRKINGFTFLTRPIFCLIAIFK